MYKVELFERGKATSPSSKQRVVYISISIYNRTLENKLTPEHVQNWIKPHALSSILDF